MPTITMTAVEALGSLNDVERKHAPALLYLAGDLSLLKRGPRISVVGSRAASAAGLARARLLVRALVARKIVVVSGLAAGIDTTAHASAIEAGGQTLAVLGTSLEESYPRENAGLQSLIMEKHLAVSQFAPGSQTQPANFPQRNRTMALITDATIIVEAGEKSGTLHQGWEALRLGRMLFLLESVANDPTLSWPAKMIHHGAQVLTRENLDAVIEEVPAVTSFRDEDLREIA